MEHPPTPYWDGLGESYGADDQVDTAPLVERCWAPAVESKADSADESSAA